MWQDRPHELSLKRGLVQTIATASTAAILQGRYHVYSSKPTFQQQNATYTASAKAWQIAASAIGSQLTTYFYRTPLPRRWEDFQYAVVWYLGLELYSGADYHEIYRNSLVNHLKRVRLRDPFWEKQRKSFLVGTYAPGLDERLAASDLLLAERDQLEAEVVQSAASGFSHGWWIFK